MDRKLYRSRSDRMIAGVAGGIADYFDLDPTIVRIGIVLLALITDGGVFLAYLIMAIVVPEEPKQPVAAPGQPGAAAPPPPAQPSSAASGETMGPGDMPEPGEFGTPPVPDPSQGVAPPPMPSVPRAEPYAGQEAPSRRGGANTIGIILVLVGVVLLFQRFFDIDLVRLWPLILIAVGISIMFRRGR